MVAGVLEKEALLLQLGSALTARRDLSDHTGIICFSQRYPDKDGKETGLI